MNTNASITVRDMSATDLERVIELDAVTGGMARRDFFRRRWQAMETAPQSYVGLIASAQDEVEGFVLGHILTGEFGTRKPLAIIDAIAVSPERRGAGVGRSLMNALKAAAKDRGCEEIRTQAGWDRQDLLGFFAGSGFTLAPLNVLEKDLAGH